MAKKTVKKLRQYRDKLLVEKAEMQEEINSNWRAFVDIRRALQKNDLLRAIAICREPEEALDEEFLVTNQLEAELTIVFQMLAIERDYGSDIRKAVDNNDWLRAKALTAEYSDQQVHNDNILHDRMRKGRGIRELVSRRTYLIEAMNRRAKENV